MLRTLSRRSALLFCYRAPQFVGLTLKKRETFSGSVRVSYVLCNLELPKHDTKNKYLTHSKEIYRKVIGNSDLVS